MEAATVGSERSCATIDTVGWGERERDCGFSDCALSLKQMESFWRWISLAFLGVSIQNFHCWKERDKMKKVVHFSLRDFEQE
jgi:hypothetical protein